MSTPQTRLCAPASAAAGNVGVLLAGAGIGISGIGDTWDLFRYLGVRSDSDRDTFACQFKPWTRDNGLFWINGQAVGLGEDGEEVDGWLPNARNLPATSPGTVTTGGLIGELFGGQARITGGGHYWFGYDLHGGPLYVQQG